MQQELFEKPEKPKINDDFLWNQFTKLGEMIGDGLHYEPDGKWITREYNKLARMLVPELKEEAKERRKIKAQKVNEKMVVLLEKSPCVCGGKLIQSRSGSKVAYCEKCNKRYKATKKKKSK